MKKILLGLFVIFSAIFIVSAATNAYFTDQESIQGANFSVSTSSNFDIKLNEIMSNPDGDDDALMPGGEWVELYNTGAWSIDVNGWRLYDAINSHELAITPANVSGGSTIIPSHGYLVVYRNGDSDFSLNNDSDTVRLYDGLMGVGTLIDSHSYINPIANWVFARIPDGNGPWIMSSNPTPGGQNHV